MEKNFLFFIGLVVIGLYLVSSVPYCVPGFERNETKVKISTPEEISQLELSSLILLHVVGKSMLPAIQDGSKCLCVKSESYSVGDVIAFRSQSGEGIAHRIISVDRERIFTKGDNNNFIDPPVTREDVLCKVSEVPRYVVLSGKFG